jgi:hypothetical protein
VAWIFVRFGPLGYNPTDDGYVLAQATRILHGQVPHRDFISPRPIGAALLHLVDLAIPLPIFEATRLVPVVEVVAYSILLAWLVYRLPPWEWGPARIAGAAGAALVDLHAFPLMPSYTIDGLLLVAAGLVLVEIGMRRDDRVAERAGLVCLGLAALMKQSFAPAPLIGLGQIAWSRRHGRGGVRTLAVDVVAAALPALLYAGAIAAAGGLAPMLTQLAGARPTYGQQLVSVLGIADIRTSVLRLAIVVVALLVGGNVCDRLQATHPRWWTVGVVVRAVLTWQVVTATLAEGLTFSPGWALWPSWGVRLAWGVVALLLARALVDRRIDGTAAVLLAVAWMCSLSWGYPVPDLVAGALALVLLERTWAGFDLPAGLRGLCPALALGALVALAAVGRTFAVTRAASPYYDRPEAQLTAPLGTLLPAFGRLRTNTETAAYLSAVRACVQQHPAREVAVLPDNAGLYPAFGLTNPFPADWLYPPEVAGSETRLLDAAAALDRRGGYLVLFQVTAALALARLPALPAAAPTTPPFAYGTTLGTDILARLHGARIACGPFVGAYAP